MIGQTAIECASHQVKRTLHGAALSTTRCMQSNGSVFRPIKARGYVAVQPLGSEPTQLD